MRSIKRIGVFAALLLLSFLPACGDENPSVMSNGAEAFSPDAMSENFLMSQVRSGGSTDVTAPLDIVWVIDNSGSMGKYQEAVQTNTRSFMQQFSATSGGSNWKMGLVSTSLSDSPYIGFTSNTPLNSTQNDNVARFQNAVGALGTGGDSTEREFQPLQKAFNANASFLRSNSLLVLIFVTDAREQSSTSVTTFLDYLKSLRGGSLDNVASYGVLGAQDLGCDSTDPDSENYKGSRFEQVITATHGAVYPLCKDFATNLLAIAKSAVTKSYTAKAKLQSKAIPESIKVLYDGIAIASSNWQYDATANTVVFTSLDFWKDTSKKIEIDYSLASIAE